MSSGLTRVNLAMTVDVAVVRRTVYYGLLTIGGETLPKYRWLTRVQWHSAEAIGDLQERRLGALLTYAAEHVPYYTKLLRDAGVVGRNGRVEAGSLRHVPLLDKRMLQTHIAEMRSDECDARRCYMNSSGGSTGEPTRFLYDPEMRQWATAAAFLCDQWAAYLCGSRRVLLWGSTRDINASRQSLHMRTLVWLRGEHWLNAFLMDQKRMRSYVEAINSLRPVQVLGYSHAVYELSRFALAEGLSLHSPRAVMSSAGTLHESMRQMVERAFGAPVFDRYGTREFGTIACECDHHAGLHVLSPLHVVEVVRPDGSAAPPGEPGELVVTSLCNYSMPLIRYRITDTASWSAQACPCGRGLPPLSGVSGRESDQLRRRDGGAVTHLWVVHALGVLYNPGWVKRFQVVQEDYGDIRVMVQALDGATVNPEEVARLRARLLPDLEQVMGGPCSLTVDLVDDIPVGPSGKHRYVVSKVESTRPADPSLG